MPDKKIEEVFKIDNVFMIPLTGLKSQRGASILPKNRNFFRQFNSKGRFDWTNQDLIDYNGNMISDTNKEDGALRKCPVGILSERASLPRWQNHLKPPEPTHPYKFWSIQQNRIHLRCFRG